MNLKRPPSIFLQTRAQHEAAHAVMQILMSGKSTKRWITSSGGHSEDTELPFHPVVCLWILLAGVAWETRGNPIDLVIDEMYEIDDALAILREFPFLRVRTSKRLSIYKMSLERTINHIIKQAWRVLAAHEVAVKKIAAFLLVHSVANPRQIGRIYRSCESMLLQDITSCIALGKSTTVFDWMSTGLIAQVSRKDGGTSKLTQAEITS